MFENFVKFSCYTKREREREKLLKTLSSIWRRNKFCTFRSRKRVYQICLMGNIIPYIYI